MVAVENVSLELLLADCVSSRVYTATVKSQGSTDTKLTGGFSACIRRATTSKSSAGSGVVTRAVARVVGGPNRQFWHEVGVWSTLHHPHIVRFIGVCLRPEGCTSLCEYYPEGR